MLSVEGTCCFPRTRGDGPGNVRRSRKVMAVSPARAGMDPELSAQVCFPRIGPRRSPFPPHARGWTVPGDRQPSRSRSFPRTRGDGPWWRTASLPTSTFPPHARGWTLDHARDRFGDIVSPARAGMDPFSKEIVRRRRESRPTRFPPHARGWTPAHVHRLASVAVSPARAGMDPREIIDSAADTDQFPPHARGWTCPARRRGGRSVSPARAGMDPSSPVTLRMTAFPPHARGWTPSGRSDMPPPPFPPHARGWTRRCGIGASRERFPRTRGDGPYVGTAAGR